MILRNGLIGHDVKCTFKIVQCKVHKYNHFYTYRVNILIMRYYNRKSKLYD